MSNPLDTSPEGSSAAAAAAARNVHFGSQPDFLMLLEAAARRDLSSAAPYSENEVIGLLIRLQKNFRRAVHASDAEHCVIIHLRQRKSITSR
ncbi:hypothetical protein PY730_27910 (plasmid) [Klebsiella pneumoniae]|nr:hypothetical protein PY730_27910 [Klebsiella pneumoniae]